MNEEQVRKKIVLQESIAKRKIKMNTSARTDEREDRTGTHCKIWIVACKVVFKFILHVHVRARTFQLPPQLSCVSNRYVIIPICEFVQN